MSPEAARQRTIGEKLWHALRDAQDAQSSKRINSQTFLGRVKDMFGIRRIYYPGCKDDFRSLERIFAEDEIIYVDWDKSPPRTLRSHQKSQRNIVIGDAAKPPFANNTFDAAFMQDMHADANEFNGIIDVLKPGGILIFSTDDCGEDDRMQLEDIRQNERVKEVELPFKTSFYTAFQKVVLDR